MNLLDTLNVFSILIIFCELKKKTCGFWANVCKVEIERQTNRCNSNRTTAEKKITVYN